MVNRENNLTEAVIVQEGITKIYWLLGEKKNKKTEYLHEGLK